MNQKALLLGYKIKINKGSSSSSCGYVESRYNQSKKRKMSCLISDWQKVKNMNDLLKVTRGRVFTGGKEGGCVEKSSYTTATND